METIMRTRGMFYAKVLQVLLQNNNIGQGKILPVGVGARYLTLGVRCSNPMALDKVIKLDRPFAYATRVKHCLTTREAGLVLFQIELPSGYWQSFTRDKIAELNLPGDTIGIAENRIGIQFNFEDAPHALFAGTSGSGKSEGVKSAIVGLANTYTPDKLSLVVIDPNMDYESFGNLAHLALPIATEANAIQQALRWTYQELTNRKANNIKDGKTLLVVIDEADSDVALKDAGNLEIAKNITKVGRKYHIHLVVSTQKPSHSELPNILDNLLNRFVGLVSDPTMSYQLTGKGKLGAHLLTGSGDFIHSVGPNVKRFQVAMATGKDFDALPRAEIVTPEVKEADIVSLPDEAIEAEEKPLGRPKNELNAKLLALYLYKQNKFSVRQAKDLLGISYGLHKMHSQFAGDVIKYLRQLRRMT